MTAAQVRRRLERLEQAIPTPTCVPEARLAAMRKSLVDRGVDPDRILLADGTIMISGSEAEYMAALELLDDDLSAFYGPILIRLD
jgi:hypothetical protein